MPTALARAELALLAALEEAERAAAAKRVPPAPAPGPAAWTWTCVVCCSPGSGETCTTCGARGPAPPAPVAPDWARAQQPAAVAAQQPQRAAPAQQASLRTFFGAAEPPPASEVAAVDLPPVDEHGLAECPTATPGVRVDPLAAQTFMFPAQAEQRQYQLSITKTCLYQNTLVVLPTGLGKTLIAATTMHNFYRWFPRSTVVFLAPTRPLVHQQARACAKLVGIPQAHMCLLTGTSARGQDGTRAEQWASHRVVFATPQTFDNDLASGVVVPSSIVCLVVDEAHRATGSYAYVTAVRRLTDAGVRFRLVALTATPGATREAIQKVVEVLHIGAVEFRAEDDPDVAPYTHSRTVDIRTIKPTAVMSDAHSLLVAGFRPMLSELVAMRVVHPQQGAEAEAALMCSPYVFVKARQALSAHPELSAGLGSRLGRAHHLLTMCQQLATGLELLTTVGLRDCLDYLVSVKADAAAQHSTPLGEAFHVMRTAVAGGQSAAPKMEALVGILRQHFGGAGSGGTRVIVFTSSREGVTQILEELRSLHSVGVRPREFIGQGDSTSRANRGDKTKGQTQAEQQAVLAAFRGGADVNVLVATCIGEEGLDVPQVDLVVFMDAVGGVRLIQRMGRTGRSRDGAVIALLAEGKEVAAWHTKQQLSHRMAHILSNANKTLELCSTGSRMLPHRYRPRMELVSIAPPPLQADDAAGAARGARAPSDAVTRRAKKKAAAGKKQGYDLLAELMGEDSDDDEEEKERPAAPVACAGAPPFLSDDEDGDASEEVEEQDEVALPFYCDDDDEGGGAMAWEVPQVEAAPAPALLPISAVLGLVACAADWARPSPGLHLQPHCPPRTLFDAGGSSSSLVRIGADGTVLLAGPPAVETCDPPPPLLPSPPPPRSLERDGGTATPVPRVAAPSPPPAMHGAVANAPTAVEVVDLTLDDDDADGGAPVVITMVDVDPSPPAQLAAPQAEVEAEARESPQLQWSGGARPSPSPPPLPKRDNIGDAAAASMPPPPPRPQHPSTVVNPVLGTRGDGASPKVEEHCTPAPPVVLSSPSLALDRATPLDTGDDGAAHLAEAPPSSGPALVHRNGMRAAAPHTLSGPPRGNDDEKPSSQRKTVKRRRLRRKASLEEESPAAAAGHAVAADDDDSSPIVRPRKPAGRPAKAARVAEVRGATGAGRSAFAGGRGVRCAMLDDEAEESDSDEHPGTRGGSDDEDGSELDDSFVTGDTGEPGGSAGGPGSTGGPRGLALYRQFMVTPDSGGAVGAAGGFALPARHGGAAYRLADLDSVRNRRVVIDSQSLGEDAGGADADGSDEDIDEEGDEEEDDEERNENVCRICRDGGHLLLCDACPAAYHHLCLGLHSVPPGDWFCAACTAAFQEAEDAEVPPMPPPSGGGSGRVGGSLEPPAYTLQGDDYVDQAQYDGGTQWGQPGPSHGEQASGRDSDIVDLIESDDAPEARDSDSDDDDAPNFDLGLGL